VRSSPEQLSVFVGFADGRRANPVVHGEEEVHILDVGGCLGDAVSYDAQLAVVGINVVVSS
jgi:hypothetical protein